MDNPRVNPLSHDGRAPSLAYNSALDGLRGVAILLVILSHAHAPLFDGAFYGVDLFFVLSGFLITSLLLQELQSNGRLDYWRFYRRRFFRLMPALALFLAAYVLFAPLLWPDLDDIYQDALVSLLYLADYGIASGEHPFTAGGSSRGLGATLAWDLAQGRGAALYLDWRDGADGQAWTFSPSYTFYSGERLGGYVEAGFGHGEGGEQVAGGGLTWRASPRVQLDLSVLRGLDADSTDWQGGFGVSVALR